MFDDVSGLTEKILCNIAEPVVLFDENIQIQWINPAAEMFFEHSTEFMAGKHCSCLFPSMTECSDSCPIKKSCRSNKIEYFVAEGINKPMKFIESIPFKKGDEKFFLVIIHNVPDLDKNKALRRDFAAELNNCKTLKSAMPVISSSIHALTSISMASIYIKKDKIFERYHGENIPEYIPFQLSHEIQVDKPLYLSAHSQSFISDRSFPEGLSLIPIINFEDKIIALLFTGSNVFTSDTRTKLEMIASVLGDSIHRFIEH